MKSFFNTFLACLAAIAACALLFFGIAFLFFAGMVVSSDQPFALDYGTVLQIDLSERIYDAPPENPFGAIDPFTFNVQRGMSLYSVLNAIERAASDPKIEGILLTVNPSASPGLAVLEEIRDELLRFKESGKFIVSYSDYYSQSSYYLSSVADQVYLNPEGSLAWHGMSSQVIFFKGLLDKLDVKPEILRYGDYKSAVEPFISDRMSPENREQQELLVNTIWSNILHDVAISRGLEPAQLDRYASELRITNAHAAVDLSLADGALYNDQVAQEIYLRIYGEYDPDDEPDYISLYHYIHSPAKKRFSIPKRRTKNLLALIYAEGEIVDGAGKDGYIGAETLARRLSDARRDDRVKAVVLRVNSPGGSALASEVIWREMTLLQEVKPVIVSMGNYAASGGYYISCPADVIVANRNTITGSIGVYGLLFNLQDAFRNKLGITVDVARTNPSADLGSAFRPLTIQERNYLQNSVNEVYETFIDHVAQGRNLTVERVDEVGQGRVWAGASAEMIGLTDGTGGLKDAIRLAAVRAGIGNDFKVVSPSDGSDQLSLVMNLLFNAENDILSEQEKNLLKEYRSVREMMERPGVQARLPYLLEMN